MKITKKAGIVALCLIVLAIAGYTVLAKDAPSFAKEQGAGMMPGTSRNAKFSKATATGNQLPGDGAVRYIRSYGDYRSIATPIIELISSKADLERFYAGSSTSNRGSINSGTPGEFRDVISMYSEDFFNDRYLVIVIIEENSGSIRHRVDGVSGNGNIAITRMLPEMGTSDMAEWHIWIELDRSFAPGQFNVVFNNVPAS